ncbi:hypothetical protein Ate02nite_49120 [Paractinoplanes tereljensis]|uniref:Uncharacterized protein n=1 Tax=Paractinoplanes tereljensis TaxID=571912 RepID=A0A919NRB6_9ACTN|nr:hypothetical protein Ate02nite_49120 [Actinoplanes tereljensis]
MLSMLATAVPERSFGGQDVERSTSETPAPLEEARRKPIDRIDRATSALIVHRVTRRDRPEVTPAFQSSV